VEGENQEPDERRAAFLSVMLTVMVGSVFVFLLFVTCGGLLVYIVAVLAGITVFGLIHYLLWGHSLSEEVAVEGEEEKNQEALEDKDWPEGGFSARRF
jgi:fatty acid desaturase